MHPASGTPDPGAQPPATPESVTVQITLNAGENARQEFIKALEEYAERLAEESENQEFSAKPAGVRFREVSSNSVVRANDVLKKFGIRAKPKKLERTALIGAPLLGAAAGVLGGYLDTWYFAVAFSFCALLMVVCVVYQVMRRLG